MAEAAIGQLLYRSVADHPFAERELQHLLRQARERNAREALTGLLIHDRGCFVQWLEGPMPALQRVWASIRADPRHRGIERLHVGTAAERLFPDWQMQRVPTAVVAPADGPWMPAAAWRRLRDPGAQALASIQDIAFWARLPPAAAMARLLARGDEPQVHALGTLVAALRPSWPAVGLHLLGPVSRALHEAWRDDALDGTDLVIAQARLRGLLRQAALARSPEPAPGEARRALVAPLPGEGDPAGVTFAAIALDMAGWQVRCRFPASTAQLLDAVRADAPDLLHLALSDGSVQAQRLADLAEAIPLLRSCAAQPGMLVLVGGRAFAEQPGLATLLGADGDGLAQGSEARDLEAMRRWVSLRATSPAMMVAQATLDDVCLQVRRRHLDPAAPGAAQGAG